MKKNLKNKGPARNAAHSAAGGYTLVEMIIYAGILCLISAVIISMLLSFSKTYQSVKALRVAENSGIYSMERISRDIMAGTDVDSPNSTFDINPGVLTIVSDDGSFSTTTKFYVEQGVLKVDVNGSYLGPLTSSNVSVTNLVFRSLDSGVSEAVRVDLTVRATVGQATKDKIYHTTVILRGTN